MAHLMHFVKGGREYVVIADNEEERAEAQEEADEEGYELSEEVVVDEDLSSWPTGRRLMA